MATDLTGLVLLLTNTKEFSTIIGIMSIVFGLIIIWKPNIISYLIAIYLILTGIIILLGGML